MSDDTAPAPGGLSGTTAPAGVADTGPTPLFSERLAEATKELVEAKADLVVKQQAHLDASAALDAAAEAHRLAQQRREKASEALVHLAGEQ